MEIQIIDDDAPAFQGLKPSHYTESGYGVLPSKRGQTRPSGEWNAMVIRAEGPRITVELNGSKILDGNVSEPTEVLPRHEGIRRKSGFLGLQSHSEPVQLRNIAIKEIH